MGTTDVKELTVEEKLEAAAASSAIETDEKKTTETKEETKVEDTKVEDTEENRIPQKRFNEVNTAKIAAQEAEAEAKGQLADSQAALVRMQELLESKEEDVQTLNEIKSFVNDPAMEPHVTAIHNKLVGIEEEVEKGDTTPEDALERAQALLEQARDEVQDTQSDVQADLLIARADGVKQQFLAGLPPEYNQDDRNTIADLYDEKIDWEAAVENPDDLTNILATGFQATVDRYGTPRGVLFSSDEVDELTPEVTTKQTPEQELETAMGKDWGATKEIETKTGTKLVPVESEEAFNALMAKLIRTAHDG